MTATRSGAETPAPVVRRAGLAGGSSDDVHVVDNGFSGLSALCGAGAITRTLRSPFDPGARGTCRDCARLIASPDSRPASRADLFL